MDSSIDGRDVIVLWIGRDVAITRSAWGYQRDDSGWVVFESPSLDNVLHVTFESAGHDYECAVVSRVACGKVS
jgi:hypothetical protein